MHDETVEPAGTEKASTPLDGQVHPQLWAVNLVSDPIHGYIELTKRLTPDHAARLGLENEAAAEGDLLDSAWLQRMRRISQLQSARWVFPTAEHSRFTHSLGVMHEAGLWARQLYPSLRAELGAVEPAVDPPSEGLVVETMRLAGLLHDVGPGPRRPPACRIDRSALALVPDLEACPRRPVDAALAALAPAVAVGRVHGGQPGLRPPRLVPDRR